MGTNWKFVLFSNKIYPHKMIHRKGCIHYKMQFLFEVSCEIPGYRLHDWLTERLLNQSSAEIMREESFAVI